MYKVGHHGRHNATLREKGLEMVTSSELREMIPLDKDWAFARKPHKWKMPFDPLYEDLVRHTGGRILRSDLGLVKSARKTAAWDEFASRVHANDVLYVELEVADKQPTTTAGRRPSPASAQ